MWPLKPKTGAPQSGSAYDHSFTTLLGAEPLPLAQYQGKVLLIVNTASECSFTPQYRELEDLHNRYRAFGLTVLGVPSNDFGRQEPGDNEQISTFCQVKYGITFPMTAKAHVRGEAAHPFYKWARECVGFAGAPKWNFHKYLIAPNGGLVDFFHSTTSPHSARLGKAIEALLPHADAGSVQG